MTIKLPTTKRLFAVAGNTCAFPDCERRLVKADVVVGQICHMRAKEKGGPRYDPSYPDPDAHENLILMCGEHHKTIDTKPLEYPTEMLEEWKRRHEERFEQPSDEVLEKLTVSINEGSVVTSINQQGGQTAHRITNVYQAAAPKPVPQLEPVIETLMGSPQHPSIDSYDFRVKLRNNGATAAKEFRLEVDIPRKYASNPTISAAEIPCPNKPDMKCYRRTQPLGFILYAHEETPDYVLTLDFQLRHEDYEAVNESIAVRLYHDDALVFEKDYPIRNFRKNDRLDHLGLS
ncbi:MAG TPA: hypothetical protein VJR02_28805 [Pyrinomonadaceae bacterium]|nr:hypothetical protein [Pyrinomonadaceae bacterium]